MRLTNQRRELIIKVEGSACTGEIKDVTLVRHVDIFTLKPTRVLIYRLLNALPIKVLRNINSCRRWCLSVIAALIFMYSVLISPNDGSLIGSESDS